MTAKQGKAQATLRDHRDALEAAAAGLPNLVAIFGDSDFLRSEAAETIRSAWLEKYPAGDTVTLRGGGETRPAALADVAAELSGGSLFAKEKLVVLRQGERVLFPQAGKNDDAPAASSGDREKGFLERLEAPPALTWLVLETATLPRNRTLGKKLAALCHLVPCPNPTQRDVPAWLSSRARALGKRFDDGAIDLLTRAHGSDLGALAGEVEKLALFAGEGEDIDAGMVREFLTGTIELEVFGFTNAIEAKNRRQAVHFARRIAIQGTRDQKGRKEDGERSSHRILAMLAGTVQGLLRARVARAEGLDPGEFAATEKLSPWRAAKLFEAASRFSLKELRTMTAVLAENMRRVHDTGGDPLLALERMAVEFTRG